MPSPTANIKYVGKYFILPLHLIICSTILINDSFFEITSINGSSMAPTLSPRYSETGERDRVLWKKWGAMRGLERGDVVLFSSPQKPESLSVKRVIGLPGDIVLLDTRRRPQGVMDGRENEDARRWDVLFGRGKGRVVVPQGHVWVEGDNWRLTNDSNAYGPVSKSLILGKARAIVWPWWEVGKRPWEGWSGGGKGGRRTKVVPAQEVVQRVHQDGGATWEPH